MRLLVFVFFIGIASNVFAQKTTVHNFTNTEGQLTWQKVFNTDLTQDQLIAALKASGHFTDIESTPSGATALFEQLTPAYKDFEESAWTIPFYISRSYVKGFLTIDFKEGRYRSTIKNVKFVQRIADTFTQMGEVSDLESWALRRRNTIFRDHFADKGGEILDYSFDKALQLKSVELSDDW